MFIPKRSFCFICCYRFNLSLCVQDFVKKKKKKKKDPNNVIINIIIMKTWFAALHREMQVGVAFTQMPGESYHR